MRLIQGRAVRALTFLSVLAAVLVPGVAAPAKTLSHPMTLARTAASAPGQTGRAAFDFPATHVGFSWIGTEGTGVRYRVDQGGGFGPWRKAPEAHDAEDAPRHFSGVIAVGRVSAVEWKPVQPARTWIGTITLDYMNTLDGPRVTQTVPAVARAAAVEPDIVTRAEWGADESLKRTEGGCQRTFYRPRQMFVHHTAGANFDTQPKATMRAIYQYHVVRQGWCDIGYNFVISADGQIFEGRWARTYAPFELHDGESRSGRIVTGAHTENFNSGTIGVSLMGNYSVIQLPPAARRTLAEFLAWEADRHGLDPTGTHVYRNPETGRRKELPFIAGHRDAGDTACPGDYVYSSLKKIRRDAAAVIGSGKLASAITLDPPATVTYGQSATVTGSLSDENGAPLASRPVRSFVRPAGGTWTVGPTATTTAKGRFGLVLQPGKNTTVVAVYDGDASTWGAQSDNGLVRVAPVVSLQADGGTLDPGGAAHYPSGTTAVPLSGQALPAHPGIVMKINVSRFDSATGVFVLEGSVTATAGSKGRFSASYPLGDEPSGTYRAIAWFPKDADHVRAASNEVFFVVDP